MKYFFQLLLACSSFQLVQAQSPEQQNAIAWLQNFFRGHKLYDPGMDEAQTDSTSSKRIYHYRVDGVHDSLEITIERSAYRFSTGKREITKTRYSLRWQDLRDWRRNVGDPIEFTLILFDDKYIRITPLLPYPGAPHYSTNHLMYTHVKLGLDEDRPFRDHLTSLKNANFAARHRF
jgi:hypothetical protein